jgi:WD40-like Beta Propeller Repeat
MQQPRGRVSRARGTLGILFLLSVSCGFYASGAAAAGPEGRGYELVSPPDFGAQVTPIIGSSAFTSAPNVAPPWNAVAADGDGVLWAVGNARSGDDSSGMTDVYLSRRGASQWTSAQVSPPGSKVYPTYIGPAAVWASADLDHILWLVLGATIDPSDHDVSDPNDPNAYLYTDVYRSDPGGLFTRITQGSLAPVVAGETTGIVGTSPDGQTVAFTSDRALEPGAASGGGVNIYVRRDGVTTLVSKDENDVPLSASLVGHASSDDGNVVVFASQGNNLYIRDRGLTHTVHIAAPPAQSIWFESLSADGRKVHFLSDAPLTADDGDTSYDLFEYDTRTDTLSRLSKPDGASGAAPGNTDACASPLPGASQCDVSPVAVSRDGSKVYFVSPERLDGTNGSDGAVNLYLAQGGTVRFVSTLDPADPDFADVGALLRPLSRHVRFTPDASKLLFESRAQLTSYDNAGHVEIYLHDPVKRSVVCVSCRPDGTPPTGDAGLRDGPTIWSSTEPMAPANADENGEHIFFQSSDTIVPQDVNKRSDVYEHEVSTGETSLISTGTSANDSLYLGNGVDGRDVFFFTTDTLVPQDRNGSLYKLYDARVGSTPVPAPELSPPCSGEGCRGPIMPAPGAAQVGTALTGARQNDQKPGAKATSRSKLSVTGSRSVKGTSARLSAKVSGPGRLRVAGSGVVRATVMTKKAGTYRVTVRLSARARASLRRAHRVSVRVTLRFAPSAGAARSTSVKLTFTSSSKKGRG